MYVTPVPTIGDFVVGRDAAGRVLRISSHPELDRVVLSIWQGGRCLATVRLAGEDVPELVRALTQSVVPDHQFGPHDHQFEVHDQATVQQQEPPSAAVG